MRNFTSTESALAFIEQQMLERNVKAAAATTSPLMAKTLRMSYTGPEMPDKGQLNGSCNRSACQLPLLGRRQWTIPSYGAGGTNGLFHYCDECASLFREADKEAGRPFRCTEVV